GAASRENPGLGSEDLHAIAGDHGGARIGGEGGGKGGIPHLEARKRQHGLVMGAPRSRHDDGEGEGPEKMEAATWHAPGPPHAHPAHSFLSASIRSPVAGWVAKKPPPLAP